MQTSLSTFNPDALRSLREKFARLILRLGANNTYGTTRHEFEVEFCYAVRELEACPPYFAGKVFDRVANICNALHQTVERTQTEQPVAVRAR